MNNIAIVYPKLDTPKKMKALEYISSVVLEHTLEYPSCLEIGEPTENMKCIYIGTKEDNPYIAENSPATLTENEEYFIQVKNNTVIIEGYDWGGVLYGCVDFYNKYIVKFENTHDSEHYFENVLLGNLPEYSHTSKPAVKNRGLWTWGHVIYDYKSYIDNMVKLKFNTLIIWNDFVPVNAQEIISYAHSLNIKVIWGYSWLWDVDCARVDMQDLSNYIPKILELYEKQYSHLDIDGIYFQSFTEIKGDKIGDVLIAEAVTEFVNRTADEFFKKFGNMELQFGLHATSVKNKLEFIKNVDSRIRIVWEDCGSFPFSYIPQDIEDFENTMSFTREIMTLRENESFGAVTKGLTKLDWGEFEHLPGKFYIGKCTKAVKENRAQRKNKIWRYVQAYWLANADKAYEAVKLMKELSGGDLYITALVEDGMFEESIMYPIALYSEMLWDTAADIKELTSSVALRSNVEFV